MGVEDYEWLLGVRLEGNGTESSWFDGALWSVIIESALEFIWIVAVSRRSYRFLDRLRPVQLDPEAGP